MKEGKRHENSRKTTKFCLMEVSTRENEETVRQGTMRAIIKENVPETFEGNRNLQLPRHMKGTSLKKEKQTTAEQSRFELHRSSYTWNFSQLTAILLTHAVQPTLFKVHSMVRNLCMQRIDCNYMRSFDCAGGWHP